MAGRAQVKSNGNGKSKPNYRRDYRCIHCGRLQFRAALTPETRIEIRCSKCGHMLGVTKEGVYGLITENLNNVLVELTLD